MRLPKQTAPVIRPDVLQPHLTLDIQNASATRLLEIKFDLLHGANYNAPMKFLITDDFCGCHIFSPHSMAMCLAICSLL
jgi:cyanobactin biosynthesis protein (PatB/AcyB/McaB family)